LQKNNTEVKEIQILKWVTGKITNKIGKVIFLYDPECGKIKRHSLYNTKLKERDVSEEKKMLRERTSRK